MHRRHVLARLPLALLPTVALLAGPAHADALAERKLKLLRGADLAPSSVQATPAAITGVPLRDAKHLRGDAKRLRVDAPDGAAPQASGASDLGSAKRRLRAG